MAAIFRKPGQETWWVTYYVNGMRFRHSLRTREERIARLPPKISRHCSEYGVSRRGIGDSGEAFDD